jgi:hypothetical protein
LSNASHAIQASLSALAVYLGAEIPGLTIYKEWPSANQKLTYPTLSLFSGQPRLMNLPPEQVAITAPDSDNMVTATYVIGELDFKLQADLWCANKMQRDENLGKVLDAINKSAASVAGNSVAGLSLQLADYFDSFVRYDLDGFTYVDDEASAQRQERRAKLDILVNCRAIKQVKAPAVKTIQVKEGVATNDKDWDILETIQIVP